MTKIWIIVLAFVLTACGTSALKQARQLDPDADPFTTLVTATRIDAEAAQKMAVQSGDTSGQHCWETVTTVLNETGAKDLEELKVIGPLSAWQRARNLRLNTGTGIDERIRSACAVLVIDAVRQGIKIGVNVSPISKVTNILGN